MRLGVYIDFPYRNEDGALSSDEAVVRFVSGLAERVDALTLFGRLDPRPGAGAYQLPKSVRLVALPHYPSVKNLPAVLRAARGSCAAFAAELERLDAVWLFGPHPLSLAFAAIARRRDTPFALGVRQDFPRYVHNRLPGPLWLWAVPLARGIEVAYRRMARDHPTVTVGEQLGVRYRRAGGPVLATGFSLMSAAEMVPLEQALATDWTGPLRVLNVGRLDPEKNPTLLPDVVARLTEADPRWSLRVIGEGPLANAVARRAEALGVSERIELIGYVPNGADLWSFYRESHAFLHVSRTEGMPQVLFEAQGAGLPIVATDVGSVREALDGGACGLLVPPDDPDAAASALGRLASDGELRRRLIAAGAARASRETKEVHLDRIMAFLSRELGS